MPGRTLLLVALLVVAGAVPIIVSEGGFRRKPEPDGETDAYRTIDDSFRMVSIDEEEKQTETAKQPFWKSWFGADGPAKSETSKPADLSNFPPLAGSPEGRRIEEKRNGPTGMTLGDALRFDVTPNWLTQNWSQVTTQLTDPDLHGIRVPYCSGYEPHDFTGSLSYYFNRQNQVERITMYGFMGEAEPLAALLTQRFGFKRYASVGPGLYLYYFGDRPLGVLRVEDAPVGGQRSGFNYRVRLEMNLPHKEAGLSDSMLSELRRLREANLL